MRILGDGRHVVFPFDLSQILPVGDGLLVLALVRTGALAAISPQTIHF